jgi:hypothetical protein
MTSACAGYEEVAATDIIVAVIRARTRVRVASNAEPSQTVSVRPAWMTWPTAITRSVFAGFKKWILNSTVSTSRSAGMTDKPARPARRPRSRQGAALL